MLPHGDLECFIDQSKVGRIDDNLACVMVEVDKARAAKHLPLVWPVEWNIRRVGKLLLVQGKSVPNCVVATGNLQELQKVNLVLGVIEHLYVLIALVTLCIKTLYKAGQYVDDDLKLGLCLKLQKMRLHGHIPQVSANKFVSWCMNIEPQALFHFVERIIFISCDQNFLVVVLICPELRMVQKSAATPVCSIVVGVQLGIVEISEIHVGQIGRHILLDLHLRYVRPSVIPSLL